MLRIMIVAVLALLFSSNAAEPKGYSREESEASINDFYNAFGIPRSANLIFAERMGNASPLALKLVQQGMLGLVQSKVLAAQEREIVDLAISYHNDCGFCVAFHKEMGIKAGIAVADVEEVASGGLPKTDPLRLLVVATKKIMAKKGFLSRIDKAQFFAGGITIAQLNEIGAHIGIYSGTNYINHINEADHPPKEFVESLKEFMGYEMLKDLKQAEL